MSDVRTPGVSAFPDWSGFTPAFAASELARLLTASEGAVAALEASAPTTYDGLVCRLDDATRDLWRCWGRVSHMLGVMNDAAWRKLEEDWQPKIVAFSLRVGQSRPLYDAAKRVLATESLDPCRRRIVEKSVQSAELAGVGLDGAAKDRFNAIQAELAKLGADFANAVIDATTPDIADAVYVEAMKHETDRAKREALYRKRSTRAPENADRIVRILALRREEAEILGFSDYASRSLATKCAPSVAAVMKMIDDLDAATVAAEKAERDELAASAAVPADGLRPWDLSFVAERLRETKYAYSEEELKRHFEFEDVLKGLFRMAKLLFGVEVREIARADRPSVWHADVRFFEVCEDGRAIAHFYLDPFARPGSKQGGAWMNEFRNRCDRLGELPLALVVLNLKDPDENGKSFMPFREVETLFHEFGHALQCMLTRIGEEDAAGISLVEWDAVEVASQFMENWCLDDRTGISVPDDLKKKVVAAKNFRAATACRRQLAFAKTDLQLHLAGPVADPDALKNANFDHFNLPRIDGDRFLCGFTHIFAGGYAAGYYGYKWAEVMSADCYGAFEEAGLGDEVVRALGRKYRETVLGLGGSRSALEVFRAFRGRDPEIAALLRQQGLLGNTL